MRLTFFICITLTLFTSCNGQNGLIENRSYLCKEVSSEMIKIDGLVDEAWAMAPWTSEFVDIEGDKRPSPYFDTRVKMLWDQDYFYVLAELEEPHVWAKLTERDAVIYYDNDFEVFIDPDGDTHNYTEIELNAFNTVWDLLLTKPYRDGGKALHQYDIKGLQTAVQIKGTLNDPTDEDEGWIVEMAIPWKSFAETTQQQTPPTNNDTWRVNFSRVQWDTEVHDGQYEKVIDPKTGKAKAEHNWVWSPQRVIAMHEPEFWGTVIFRTTERASEDYYADFISEEIRQRLYQLHRYQIQYKRDSGVYKNSKDEMLSVNYFITGDNIIWDMQADRDTYHIIMQHPQDRMLLWHIDHTGRIWRELRE